MEPLEERLPELLEDELPEEERAVLPAERLLEELLPDERTVEEEPLLLRAELAPTREELCRALLREELAATRLEELTLRDTEDVRAALLLRLTLLREAPLPNADAERVLRATLWRPLFSGPSKWRSQ